MAISTFILIGLFLIIFIWRVEGSWILLFGVSGSASLTVYLLKEKLLLLLDKMGFRQYIREEGPAHHQSKKNTPTAGGIIFLLAIPLLFAWDLINENLYHPTNTNSWITSTAASFNEHIIACCVICVLSGTLGFADDYLKKAHKRNEGLTPKQKFLGQLVIAIILFMIYPRTGTYLGWYEITLGKIGMLVFAFLLTSGTMNAVNLTDGLDGLACSVLGVSFLGVAFVVDGGSELKILSMLMAGLCFAFLLLNKHPARVFMGDTGSFLLGGTLAAIAWVSSKEWWLFAIIFVPILEIVSVIIQIACSQISRRFWRLEWRPFKMTPLHHHLEFCGWSEKKIVYFMCLLQLIVISLVLLIDAYL